MAYVMKRYSGTSWVPAVKRYWDGSKWVGVDGASDVLVYDAEVLADSPVAYWRHDEVSGRIQDASGNGHHATSGTGTKTYQQPPLIGDGFSIHYASGGYESVPDHADFDFSTPPWALEFWMNPDTVASYDAPVDKRGSSGDGWGVFLNTDGGLSHVQMRLANGGSNQWLGGSGLEVVAGSVFHVVFKSDGTNVFMYINGGEEWTASHTVNPAGTSKALVLGARQDGTEGYEGYLDAVAIYNTDLTADRIQAHYDAGVA